jgi:hypothetical protein
MKLLGKLPPAGEAAKVKLVPEDGAREREGWMAWGAAGMRGARR